MNLHILLSLEGTIVSEVCKPILCSHYKQIKFFLSHPASQKLYMVQQKRLHIWYLWISELSAFQSQVQWQIFCINYLFPNPNPNICRASESQFQSQTLQDIFFFPMQGAIPAIFKFLQLQSQSISNQCDHCSISQSQSQSQTIILSRWTPLV